jgi:WD40 repeat protein
MLKILCCSAALLVSGCVLGMEHAKSKKINSYVTAVKQMYVHDLTGFYDRKLIKLSRLLHNTTSYDEKKLYTQLVYKIPDDLANTFNNYFHKERVFDKSLYFMHVHEETLPKVAYRHPSQLLNLDAQVLAYTDEQGTIFLQDISTNKIRKIRACSEKETNKKVFMAFCHPHEVGGFALITINASDAHLKIWQLSDEFDHPIDPCSLLYTHQFQEKKDVTATTIAYRRRYIAIGMETGEIYLCDLKSCNNNRLVFTCLTGHDKAVSSLDFNHQETVLISADDDGSLLVWDLLATPIRPLQKFKINEKSVHVHFNPDSRSFMAYASNGPVTLFEKMFPDLPFPQALFVHRAIESKKIDTESSAYKSLSKETKEALEKILNEQGHKATS